MDIKIYTTPACSWCKKLKEWLKKKRCSFQDLDVSESDKYREELITKSGQVAVPVIEIDGQIIIGFQEKVIEDALLKGKNQG